MTRRMVIAPHADDESMGCGGLMAKYPEDWTIVLVAQPDKTRYGELMAAFAELGVRKSLVELNLPDGTVGREPRWLVARFDALLVDYQPDELYLPWPGVHQDHVAVYEAGMRAARLSMSGAHWCPPRVLVYDIPVYDLELYPTGLRWNVFESLTGEQVSAKARAVAAYQSQVDHSPYFALGKEVLDGARALGAQHGVLYAERYALVRDVR